MFEIVHTSAGWVVRQTDVDEESGVTVFDSMPFASLADARCHADLIGVLPRMIRDKPVVPRFVAA